MHETFRTKRAAVDWARRTEDEMARVFLHLPRILGADDGSGGTGTLPGGDVSKKEGIHLPL